MSQINRELKHLPYLKCTEHLMPMGNADIRGAGYSFTHTITDGLRAGGLWLVMQDDAGQAADSNGDIIMFAAIEDVDWLSDSQIKLKLAVQYWGRIVASGQQSQTLKGQVYPLWHDSTLASDDILVVRLHQCTSTYYRTLPSAAAAPPDRVATNWVCWRWLELLPIPLGTKQRLLKYPTSQLCLRYLKKIIRHSDRLN